MNNSQQRCFIFSLYLLLAKKKNCDDDASTDAVKKKYEIVFTLRASSVQTVFTYKMNNISHDNIAITLTG